MASVLYSGIGTTDPVRNMRDGGMLHIMRFYRPEKVYLFLTAEMTSLDEVDHRFKMTFDYVREHWDGYAPELIRVDAPIEDPSDMDALLNPMEELLERVARENPDSEILLNLSSGTPQMEIILAQMAMDPRYRIKGIQVKNPDRKSGSGGRNNNGKWITMDDLELNLDEEPDVVNRCREPKMMAIRREATRNQLMALVDQRNYAAIAQMGSQLPAPYPQLARHLDHRSNFRLKEAEAAAEHLRGMGLNADQGPYPYRVYQMVEFFTVLKHQVHLKRYTNFVLRLNPFVVELQMILIRDKLDERGIPERDLFPVVGGRKKISPAAIGKCQPELLAYMETQFGGPLKEADLSIKALNMMLEWFGADKEQLDLLAACEKVNAKLRNLSAHDLFAVTNQRIVEVCGLNAETIIHKLEQVLTDAVARYGDRALKKRLNIYEHGDQLLRDCL